MRTCLTDTERDDLLRLTFQLRLSRDEVRSGEGALGWRKRWRRQGWVGESCERRGGRLTWLDGRGGKRHNDWKLGQECQ